MIVERIFEILSAIGSKPLIYMPLIGAWLITGIYFIINKDEKHGHSYVMSTGIAHIFTAYMISPFAIPELEWSFNDLRVIVIMALFAYGLILTILGIAKACPDFLAELLGDPGHALVPSIMAVLYVDGKVPFDWTTFIILFVPVFIFSIIKTIRRFTK
jgi:hypothetical protein